MSPLERAEKALRDALLEQSKEIYFYDNADRELFLDLPREWDEFEGGKLADRFDLSAVTRAVLEALREPSERMEQGGATIGRMMGKRLTYKELTHG